MSSAVQGVVVAAVIGAAAAYAIVSAVRAYRGKAPSCCQTGAASAKGESPCGGCPGCGK